MEHNQKSVHAAITAIKRSETTARKNIGEISRVLVEYIPFTGDIDAANRLLEALNPDRREKMRSFLSAHLAYNWGAKELRFTGKSKNPEVVAKKMRNAEVFLSDGEATFWTWLADQAVAAPVAKPKEYEKKIAALVKKAIEDKDEHVPVSAVIRAIITAGASLSEIMEALMPGKTIDGDTTGQEIIVPKRKAA